MKVFKVMFHQHHNLKKKYGYVIVVAQGEMQAIEFAKRDVVDKVPGYAYVINVRELCKVVEGKSAYVSGDFMPMSLEAYYV